MNVSGFRHDLLFGIGEMGGIAIADSAQAILKFSVARGIGDKLLFARREFGVIAVGETIEAILKIAVPKSESQLLTLRGAQGLEVFGVAVVENGYRQPCAIEVVPPSYDAFLESDQRLLRLAKQHLAKIPFEKLDPLIVDELGKTVSGAGMDPNVIGHWRNSNVPRKPDYKRIVVLSLTHASLGNGLGIGMADFTTRRFAEAYDPVVSYVNLLTASEPDGNTREGPLPLALGSDREAIEVVLFPSSLASASPRVCRIHNTALLGEMWISEALAEEARASRSLEVLETPRALAFRSDGNLW